MTTVKGTRIYSVNHRDLSFVNPGDYWVDEAGYFMGACPVPREKYGTLVLCSLGSHTVKEHEDGSISVWPSILVTRRKNEQLYHGYLEHGVWREL